MTNLVNPKPIGSLDDLEQAAKAAAEQLGKASSHNAIWDKATKSLKQGLAGLAKTRTDAEMEAGLAEQLRASLADSYDSEASRFVRQIRTAVDAEIAELATTMSTAEQALNQAKTDAAQAKVSLDESNVKSEEAQRKLVGMPKEIQDRQKQLAALEAEVKDAHSKHQLVEAVVKLADLELAITELKNVTKPEYEAELWQALNSAVGDLIQKTEALATAQGVVPVKEAGFNKAKTERDEAQKNRLDRIRKLVADEESAPKRARQS